MGSLWGCRGPNIYCHFIWNKRKLILLKLSRNDFRNTPSNSPPVSSNLISWLWAFTLWLKPTTCCQDLSEPIRLLLSNFKPFSFLSLWSVAHLNIRSLNNKSLLCHDFITLNNWDYFSITETWLSQGDSSPLVEATLTHLTHLHQLWLHFCLTYLFWFDIISTSWFYGNL